LPSTAIKSLTHHAASDNEPTEIPALLFKLETFLQLSIYSSSERLAGARWRPQFKNEAARP
jgi:hypothetical protein